MSKPKVVRELAQSRLFESAPLRPRWEDLPLEVRHQVIRLLSELLSSRIAQSLLTERAKGGDHE